MVYPAHGHLLSIAGMSPQSHCGDEDGHTGLSTMTSLYMYYAIYFVHVEHSVCHEPISVLINIFTLLA